MKKKFDNDYDNFLYYLLLILFILIVVTGLALAFHIVTVPRPTSEEVEIEPGNGITDVIFETYTNALDTAESDRAEVREINNMDISTYYDGKVDYSPAVQLLAQLVIAEAENQSELGKQLVADVVLNRVEHDSFPNSIEGVIFDPGQFSCVSNGRFDACADKVTDDICELVYNQMYERQSWIVLYFKTDGYFGFGEPICHVGDHWFSGE